MAHLLPFVNGLSSSRNDREGQAQRQGQQADQQNNGRAPSSSSSSHQTMSMENGGDRHENHPHQQDGYHHNNKGSTNNNFQAGHPSFEADHQAWLASNHAFASSFWTPEESMMGRVETSQNPYREQYHQQNQPHNTHPTNHAHDQNPSSFNHQPNSVHDQNRHQPAPAHSNNQHIYSVEGVPPARTIYDRLLPQDQGLGQVSSTRQESQNQGASLTVTASTSTTSTKQQHSSPARSTQMRQSPSKTLDHILNPPPQLTSTTSQPAPPKPLPSKTKTPTQTPSTPQAQTTNSHQPSFAELMTRSSGGEDLMDIDGEADADGEVGLLMHLGHSFEASETLGFPPRARFGLYPARAQ